MKFNSFGFCWFAAWFVEKRLELEIRIQIWGFEFVFRFFWFGQEARVLEFGFGFVWVFLTLVGSEIRFFILELEWSFGVWIWKIGF